jgi:hypothetical protein
MKSMAESSVKPTAQEYLITTPTTLVDDYIRVDIIADPQMEDVYVDQGNYWRLNHLYQEAADLCAKTMKNKRIDAKSIKKLLQTAKKKCLEQVKYVAICRDHVKKAYEATVQVARDVDED